MQVNVRRATNADIADVVRVIKAVYDEFGFSWDPAGYHSDLYDLEASYDLVGDSFWVAEANGQTMGTVAYERFPTIPGEIGATVIHNQKVRACGCDSSLERLYVHPDGRRKGLGLVLLDCVIQQARIENRPHIEIWSDKKFLDAHRLYEKRGAFVVGERLCDDPEESPEWGLVLPV